MKIDLADPRFKANPYSFYARLREESPVCAVTLPNRQPAWLITRYDDALAVLKDPRFIKDRSRLVAAGKEVKQPWIPAFFKPLTRNMLDLDEPDHTRLRALVHKAFTPGRIEEMRGRIETVTGELLEGAASHGRMDIIRDYALPLPTTIIAEMLGVPTADRHKFNRWSNSVVAANASRMGMPRALPAVWRFLRYIRRMVKMRRRQPLKDLVSALVEAEQAGDHLNEDELLAMIFLLLVAGHETTVNLIGNGMLSLLQHPDQLEKLRTEPQLIGGAVEELLRFSSPLNTATERYAGEDIRMGGAIIHRGALVFVVISSANRDPRQFPDPDTLDITRSPNQHLSFGQGIHYCLGAPLARMEGQIAISHLLARFPGLRLSIAPEKLRWRRGLVLRGLQRLPVEFTP